jgi:hypothetical protein
MRAGSSCATMLMEMSWRWAPARGRFRRRCDERYTIATRAAASRAADCPSARDITSNTGQTVVRRRSRTSPCSVAGTTVPFMRKVFKSTDAPTAYCSSGGRMAGSYTTYRLRRRRPIILCTLFALGTSRRACAFTHGRHARAGEENRSTCTGRSASCIRSPWDGRRPRHRAPRPTKPTGFQPDLHLHYGYARRAYSSSASQALKRASISSRMRRNTASFASSLPVALEGSSKLQ